MKKVIILVLMMISMLAYIATGRVDVINAALGCGNPSPEDPDNDHPDPPSSPCPEITDSCGGLTRIYRKTWTYGKSRWPFFTYPDITSNEAEAYADFEKYCKSQGKKVGLTVRVTGSHYDPQCPECDKGNNNQGRCVLSESLCGECEDTKPKCPDGLSDKEPSCSSGYKAKKEVIPLNDGSGKSITCYGECKCKKKTCAEAGYTATSCPSGYELVTERPSDGCGSLLSCPACKKKDDDPTPVGGDCPNPACGPQFSSYPTKKVEYPCNCDTCYDDDGWPYDCDCESCYYWDPAPPPNCQLNGTCIRACNNCVDASTCSPYGCWNAQCDQSCNCVGYPGGALCGPRKVTCKDPSCEKHPSTDLNRASYCIICNTYVGFDGYGGIRRCYGGMDADPEPYDPSRNSDYHSGSCTTGGDKCCRYKTCAQINPAPFTQEWDYGATPTSTHVFNKDPGGNAGTEHNGRCGYYVPVSPPFWTSVGGNIFARDDIKNGQRGYGIHAVSDTNICNSVRMTAGSSNAFTAGLAMSNQYTNGAFSLFGTGGQSTQRAITNTNVYPAIPTLESSMTADGKLGLSFNYFASLIEYASLPECREGQSRIQSQGNLGTSSADDSTSHYACRVPGNVTTNDLISYGLDINGTGSGIANFTVFVHGNLGVKTPVIAPIGTFKAFIVQGETKVDKNVGREMSSYCPSADCQPLPAPGTVGDTSVQGVFVTSKFVIEKQPPLGDSDPFNPDAACDKQFNFQGTLIQYGGDASTPGDLTVSRTFKGCNLHTAYYCDLNANNPTVTFTYRPDFLTHTPNWMRQSVKLRLETL